MSNKAIGQFFSGASVSDLLVLATGLDDTSSIAAIDPMVGQADMLVALHRRGANADRLYGIDIDGTAVANASKRLEHSHLLKADALSKDSVGLYNAQSWDLVITNPPYVRYQALDALYGDNAVEKLRNNLIETLEALNSDGDKRAYIESARTYSGLSDLAVPCWILCACLVKPGGKLAMVLPDAWLKREYATAIRSILSADYSIDRIIVDEGRSWFSEAQVKTNLLIATKQAAGEDGRGDSSVYYIGLLKGSAHDQSLVGALAYDGLTGDDAFRKLCKNEADFTSEAVWARHEPLNMTAHASRLEGRSRTATLQDWGINVGQGLRTGANGFFYFKTREDGRASNDIWERCVGNEPIDAGLLPLMPALRYQGDMANSYSIRANSTTYLLLRINEPVDADEPDFPPNTAALFRYIQFCERHDIAQDKRQVRIPNLSAVRTNGALSTEPNKKRYWYMLPQLKNRHLPDLVIPRINGGAVRAYHLPDDKQVVVDANFSTLWVNGNNATDKHIALALLNSTYVRLELERVCSVLGGGALKCEAVSLRKLKLPEPSAGLREKLRLFGEQLATTETIDATTSIQGRIDHEIAREIASDEGADSLMNRWNEELDIRLRLRNE